MLHIILLILKIIGITLLAILGMIVLLVCVVLFVPLKYQIEVTVDSKHEAINLEKNHETIKASAGFSWLFRLISGHIHYINKELEWQISILGKKIDATFLENKQISDDQDTIENDLESKKTNSEQTGYDIQESDEVSKDIKKESTTEKNNEKEEVSDATTEENSDKKKGQIFKRVKDTIKDLCDKIKLIKEKKEVAADFINDDIHKVAFSKVKQEIFRFLKLLKPQKFRLKLHFGFEDPALTGKMLGVICMLYPIFEDSMDITPDFQNIVLEGEIFIKGKFKCVYPVGVGVRLVLDKNVRRTVMDLMPKQKNRKNQKNKSKKIKNERI